MATPNDTTPTKVCSKCKRELPATREYFVSHNQKRDGLRPECRDCTKKQRKSYRDRNREYFRAYRRKRYADNPKWDIEYRHKHRDKILIYLKKYSAENSADAVQRSASWVANNPDRARLLGRIGTQRRNKRMRNAEGYFSADDILALHEDQCDLCGYCGIRLCGDYEVDHITPISRGGTNWPDNLLLVCPSCNAKKSARTPDEWMAVRGW